MRPPTQADLSNLPSIDELVKEPDVAPLLAEFGRDRALSFVRAAVEGYRIEAREGGTGSSGSTREELRRAVSAKTGQLAASERRSGVRRVINATGVVIHTNLGRAPLSSKSAEAMIHAAGYSTIEYDGESGTRGQRGKKALSSIGRLTGAEAALVVNNCAAAAFLVLSAFARGREVIVSRGELVEIGGDFRIPDVLERSGAIIREVGTTNRTHLRDYEEAINERTAMLLKVHPSNFRISGFTTAPETRELVALAREHGILFYEDAGSGAIESLDQLGIRGEPVIRDIVAAGADLVTFSGDKLLGGPQSGIIVGRGKLVGRLSKDPLFRALRVDKMITAALEATLEHYLTGEQREKIPVLRMLGQDGGSIGRRAGALVQKLRESLSESSGWRVEIIESISAVGGGASPDARLSTFAIAISNDNFSEREIESMFRRADPPVIARIENERVLLDLRTVAEEEEAELLRAVAGRDWRQGEDET